MPLRMLRGEGGWQGDDAQPPSANAVVATAVLAPRVLCRDVPPDVYRTLSTAPIDGFRAIPGTYVSNSACTQ